MLKAHRIRIYPTPAQARLLDEALAIHRFAYNHMVAVCRRHQRWYGKYPRATEVAKRFRARRDVLLEIYQPHRPRGWLNTYGCYLYEVTDELSQAISSVIALKRRIKAGERRASKRPIDIRFIRHDDSPQSFYLHNRQFAVNGHAAQTRYFGVLRAAESLRFSGKIMGARVVKQAGMWFISIQVETGEPLPHPGENAELVGVDLGYGKLITTSDGRKYDNPRNLARSLKRLACLQRALSRKRRALLAQGKEPEESKRYCALRLRVQRLHYRIACQRGDAAHNATTDLVRRYDGFALEGYDVQRLMSDEPRRENGKTRGEKRRRNREMSDAAVGELRRQIEYKAQWAGKPVVKLNKDAATNVTCSACGARNDHVTLAMDTWTCIACGATHDRRINAAINARQLARTTNEV